jgi:hypothetical protein
MVVVLCAAIASSCGGGGGVASCGKVQPCGGDPVGTWKFAGQCANTADAFDNEFCPTATTSVSGLSASGTTTFSADGTYTLNVTESGTVQMTIPSSCLTQNGITLTCAQLQQSLQAAFADDPDSPIKSATCSGSSSCSCALTMSSTTTENGTYTVDGTSLSLSGGSGSGAFCVKDKELHLITVDTTMSMGTMGQVKISSDIVATKQ